MFVLGSVGGCDDAPPKLVIQVDGATRVALQDGDGPWLAVSPGKTGHAEIQVTSGRYGLAYLCSYSSDQHTTFLWSTVPDTRTASCGTPTTEFMTLSGLTSPGAKVFVDGSVQVAPSGMYTASLAEGVHDVFAILPGTPARLLVERAVALSSDRVVDLPVATDGVEMPMMTPTVRGASGPVSVYSDLNTANAGYVVFGTNPATVPVPPVTVLVAGDQAAIGASSTGCVVQQPLRAEPPVLELPNGLEVQLDRTAVTWQSDPEIDWELLRLEMSGFVLSPTNAHRISVMGFVRREWLEASGQRDNLVLPDLAALPGWQTAQGAYPAGTEVDWTVSVVEGQAESDYRACSKSGSLPW